MAVVALVRDYYDTLRAGEPLYPFFRESPATVKYGLSETLRGYEAVAEGLREQTRTTAGWTVESRHLTAGARDGPNELAGDATSRDAADVVCGWFADDVVMSWTNTDRQTEYEFETRWSGTVVDGEFAAVHVSTTEAL
jgi:hypothetical protein